MNKYLICITFLLISIYINAQTTADNIIGSSITTILTKEGKPDIQHNADNEDIIRYNSKKFLDYDVEVIYLFLNGYLYGHSYLFKDINQNEITDIFNSLVNKFILFYGTAYHIDTISNPLHVNQSPYKAIWNYNGQRIDIKMTHQITNRWGLSIMYQVRTSNLNNFIKE